MLRRTVSNLMDEEANQLSNSIFECATSPSQKLEPAFIRVDKILETKDGVLLLAKAIDELRAHIRAIDDEGELNQERTAIQQLVLSLDSKLVKFDDEVIHGQQESLIQSLSETVTGSIMLARVRTKANKMIESTHQSIKALATEIAGILMKHKIDVRSKPVTISIPVLLNNGSSHTQKTEVPYSLIDDFARMSYLDQFKQTNLTEPDNRFTEKVTTLLNAQAKKLPMLSRSKLQTNNQRMEQAIFELSKLHHIKNTVEHWMNYQYCSDMIERTLMPATQDDATASEVVHQFHINYGDDMMRQCLATIDMLLSYGVYVVHKKNLRQVHRFYHPAHANDPVKANQLSTIKNLPVEDKKNLERKYSIHHIQKLERLKQLLIAELAVSLRQICK